MVDVPERSATLVDAAGVMSEAGRARTMARLQDFSRPTGHDAVAVTVATTAPLSPSEYAMGLFERWRVGGETRDGVMMLVAIAEQQVECILGPALQPALAEADADALLRDNAVPHFLRGDFDAGVFHGLDMLARVFEHVEGLK
jgi:uncharacterized membrane protein YgcG